MGPQEYLTDPGMTADRAVPFLEQLGFSDPRRADQILSQLASAPHLREALVRISEPLFEELSRTPDPDLAIVQFGRFCEAVGNPASLFHFLAETPPAIPLLVQVCGTSPYLSQSLIRNPDYFYWLLQDGHLERPVGEEELFKQTRKSSRRRLETRLNGLRRLKRREILRIAAQDLLDFLPFEQIVGEISQLADVLVRSVFDLTAETSDFRAGADFAILALGKLGGHELNYSSDIDLLYVCSDDCEHLEAVTFARTLTRVLDAVTTEGRLYRVDLRLRPMGRTGEIVYPMRALRHYYSSWGDTFDRLALLKCRWCAGSRELADEFLAFVQAFVYRKYLDNAAVEEIASLKRSMDREQRLKSSPGTNVKLGRGGIREIEYFVQSFQLVYGARNESLRTTSTLALLDHLVDAGHIPVEDYRALGDAYRWLRTVEHRLQLIDDQARQVLPDEQRALKRLARSLLPTDGPDPIEQFQKQLEETTGTVNAIFSRLFGATPQTSVAPIALDPHVGREAALTILKETGLTDVEGVHDGLKMLLGKPTYPQSPSRIRNLLANLFPHLTQVCERGGDARAFFGRFSRLQSSFGSAEVLLRSLLESPDLRDRVLEICLLGGFLFETLLRFPELLDSLSEADLLEFELPAWSDEETADLSAIRTSLWKEQFKIAVSRVYGRLSEIDARHQLTQLADLALTTCFRATLQENQQLQGETILLFGLGSLGASELTFFSDLDLVCVYDDRSASPIPRDVDDWLRALQNRLGEYSGAGPSLAIDLRLRPEGRRSSPATPLSAFQSYWEQRAESWERVAYSRMRLVASSGTTDPLLTACLSAPASRQLDPADIHHLRLRKERELSGEETGGASHPKFGRGGLLDIQILLALLLSRVKLHLPSTFEAIARVEEKGLLPPHQCRELEAGWRFLASLESFLRILRGRNEETIYWDAWESGIVASWLDTDTQLLQQKYQETTERIRTIYSWVLGVDPTEA